MSADGRCLPTESVCLRKFDGSTVYDACSNTLLLRGNNTTAETGLEPPLYKVVLTFESVDEIQSVTIQMKATEQYFPVVLFIMLYKVVLTFHFVDETLKRDHLNKRY